ncbi:phosphocholine cytidylyltransferase family protein [Desulfonatronum parangueonense]
MPSTVAVILAAGRGSRMNQLTQDRPKCLTPLAGRPLLFWQLDALARAGIAPVLAVTGYLEHVLRPSALNLRPDAFSTAHNERWSVTNMLASLFCAEPWIQDHFSQGAQQVLISYADITYHPRHLAALAACRESIAVSYDLLWEPLWRLRFGDPLLDAETFRAENGRLLEIGARPQSLDQVQGQYMGLIKVTPAGWAALTRHTPQPGPERDRMDMTGLLRRLLAANVPIGAVAVRGKWCEVDNQEDLRAYERMLEGKGWSHDWRE